MLLDIVPKAQYAMTVGRYKYSWGTGPPADPGQCPGGGPVDETPGSSEDTSYYSTKSGLKLMHFSGGRGIVVGIIRIGRQNISQKITFIFYTNEGVRNP